MHLPKPILLLLILVASYRFTQAQPTPPARESISFDAGWRFAPGHATDASKDFQHATGYFSYLAKAAYGDGPAAPAFDDRAWRTLDLPHDWVVELPFSPVGTLSHGSKAVGRHFPENSVGWYRKTFTLPATDKGRHIRIRFDGVYRNAKVWLNGHYLGNEPGGYLGFEFNLTEYLEFGSENVLVVRADASMEEGWYYEGAGIYRHVWLIKSGPVRVPYSGAWAESRITGAGATVMASTRVENTSPQKMAYTLRRQVLDAEGKEVARDVHQGLLQPFEQGLVFGEMAMPEAIRWDVSRPYRYRMVCQLESGGQPTDRYEFSFGIRTVRFDADSGFFLNEKPLKLKGTNNHQDHAGVGVAVPDELLRWRLRQLQAMGCNAYRCSHHPPSPELLDLCDELGMLVINENRLMGVTELHLGDLRRMIERDRNHPGIITWSIGNEEWGIENTERGERIALTMQQYVQAIDSTRSVTAGISGGFVSGISSVLEVMGYNYRGNGDFEAHRSRFPDQPGMGTEEGSTFATRGVYFTDTDRHLHAAYDLKPRPRWYSIEENWKYYAARPWLAGMFIWTGFDYRGEPTPYGWPSVTSYFGMMDLCGFPKDNVYYLKSWWTNEPVLHLLPHWNWPGREGTPIDVWVYSNCDEVELFLNKKSLGKQRMPALGHLEWKVPYQPGVLQAVGYKAGKKVLTDTESTSDAASALVLNSHKPSLVADGQDVAIFTVSTTDAQGRHVPTADHNLTFELSGPGRIIGVGNGSPVSLEKEKFTESIVTVPLSGLKEIALTAFEMPVSVPGAGDSRWQTAFSTRDYNALAPAYLTRGVFSLPDTFSQATITLFFKSIGIRQEVYVNGKRLDQPLPEGQNRHSFSLSASQLRPGENEVLILHTPIPKRHPWDEVNTDPGLVQLFTPVKAWYRSLFNGYAQVIVQSTSTAGPVTLTARGAGLTASQVTLDSRIPEPKK